MTLKNYKFVKEASRNVSNLLQKLWWMMKLPKHLKFSGYAVNQLIKPIQFEASSIKYMKW
ncbi:4291_t:CDS:2 [Funneliformis mosseae]|uniref:4291_t:CDS:1 n=1 Tax=Funneliformis mosseae TaxID=27381 RepID=A0A9N9A6A6_FUNMO|nr:4291_t:CDS:2 [Funneliformis mosseae]